MEIFALVIQLFKSQLEPAHVPLLFSCHWQRKENFLGLRVVEGMKLIINKNFRNDASHRT